MTPKKSCMISLLAVLASVCIYPLPTFANVASRPQFLQEALSWMTFKKDGKLMTAEELKPLFLDTILSKYSKSKFYRVFVIQFQLGVLPKLSITEGQACDPSYTWKYKDPKNSSVTWHYQKQFVAESYKNRNSPNEKYCDYRQGLICNQFTRKCECPEGSTMQEIEQGSSVKRCLFEENEICSLIDIDHGNDQEHKHLARDLPKIIFSLEKPVSCKVNTQCRFKNGYQDFPRCYNLNDGPWVPDNKKPGVIRSWSMKIGKECVIGLYANPGSCDTLYKTISTPPPGLVCYNFGPLRSNPQSSNRTGYCSHEFRGMGSSQRYSLDEGENEIELRPQLSLIGFVHARSTPLRGDDLTNYHERYGEYSTDNGLALLYQKCSIQLTDESIEIWKYYVGLEKDPPPGQDYVPEATKEILEQKLSETLALAPGFQGKRYCSIVFWRTPSQFNPDEWQPPLKCVAHGNPADEHGNDGTCQLDPGNVLTKPLAEEMQVYLKYIAEIFRAEREEDKLTSEMEQILEENTDTCKLGGSDCSTGFECFEDLRDEQGIYDSSSCKLISQALNSICQDLSDNSNTYGTCESQQLDDRIKREFQGIVRFPNKLGRGEECQADLESNIRTALRNNQPVDGNKYKMLKILKDEKNGIGKGLCEYTRLLECSSSTSKCECFDNTAPRDVTFGGVKYQSDYCYKTSGDCRASSFEDFYKALTVPEKAATAVHYGKPDDDCKYTNLCLFVTNDNFRVCTKENTGMTGGDKKPVKPTKPTGPGGGNGNWNKPPGNGWGEAGVERLCVANWSLVGFIIMTMTALLE